MSSLINSRSIIGISRSNINGSRPIIDDSRSITCGSRSVNPVATAPGTDSRANQVAHWQHQTPDNHPETASYKAMLRDLIQVEYYSKHLDS